MNFGSEYVFEFDGDTLNVRDNDFYMNENQLLLYKGVVK